MSERADIQDPKRTSFVQAIGVVVIRAFALSNIIFSTSTLLNYAVLFVAENFNQWIYYVQFIVSIIVGILLWIFAIPLSSKLIGRAQTEPPAKGVTASELVEVGSFLIGVYFICFLTPDFLKEAFHIAMDLSEDQPLEFKVTNISVGGLIKSGFLLVMASILTLRAGDVGRLFVLLRSASMYKGKSLDEE